MAMLGVLLHSILILYATFSLDAFCILCFICYSCTLIIAAGITAAIYELRKTKEPSMKPHWIISTTTLFKNSKALLLTFAASLVMITAIGGCIFADSKEKKENKSPEELFKEGFEKLSKEYRNAEVRSLNLENSPRKGAKDPAITIVEYADFMCPHCNYMAQTLNASKKRCANLIQVVYKHFPLDKNCNSSMRQQLHEGACELSHASVCAQ